MILDGVRKRWPWLKHLFADGAYDRTQLMDKAAFRDFTIQIVKRSDTAKGFEVLPRRWVVRRERSDGCREGGVWWVTTRNASTVPKP